MRKMSKEEFVKAVINSSNGGMQNDTDDIWADIEGTEIQASAKISDVFGIDYEEKEPFGISCEIEADEGHIAWGYLYDDYSEKFDEMYAD